MKRFEFRLPRILHLRRQQAEAERAHFEAQQAALELIAQEIRSLAVHLEHARAHVRHAPSSAGDDYIALSHFESHIEHRTVSLDQHRAHVTQQMAQQRAKVLEAERKLKRLENLEARHHRIAPGRLWANQYPSAV